MSIEVFFDLDNVLADFTRGALAIHGRSDIPIKSIQWAMEKQIGITENEFYAPMNYSFWANLEPCSDGMALLRKVESLVGEQNISLFTSLCDGEGCYDGKREWVRKHLKGYQRRLFTGADKWRAASPSKVLIDDRTENVNMWHLRGGQSVLVPRPWNGDSHLTDDQGRFDVQKLFEVTHRNVRVAAIG